MAQRRASFLPVYAKFRKRDGGAWVRFSTVAKWAARVPGTGEIDEGKLLDAYSELLGALRRGKLTDGRFAVRFVYVDETTVVASSVAGPWLVDAIDSWLAGGMGFRDVVKSYLRHCWMRRGALLRWCESIRLDPSPEWLAPIPIGVASKEVKRRGRKPGTGSYAAIDAPFLAEMQSLLDSCEVVSAERAAALVVERNPHIQGASPESTQTRLAKRFRKTTERK